MRFCSLAVGVDGVGALRAAPRRALVPAAAEGCLWLASLAPVWLVSGLADKGASSSLPLSFSLVFTDSSLRPSRPSLLSPPSLRRRRRRRRAVRLPRRADSSSPGRRRGPLDFSLDPYSSGDFRIRAISVACSSINFRAGSTSPLRSGRIVRHDDVRETLTKRDRYSLSRRIDEPRGCLSDAGRAAELRGTSACKLLLQEFVRLFLGTFPASSVISRLPRGDPRSLDSSEHSATTCNGTRLYPAAQPDDSIDWDDRVAPGDSRTPRRFPRSSRLGPGGPPRVLGVNKLAATRSARLSFPNQSVSLHLPSTARMVVSARGRETIRARAALSNEAGSLLLPA